MSTLGVLCVQWEVQTHSNREQRAPHRCTDKSSFLTQLSDSVTSERAQPQAKGTFQVPEKLQNKLENKQSHWVILIILYVRSHRPEEEGRLHPTMNNNTHVVILGWHFLKWHLSHKSFISPAHSPPSRGSWVVSQGTKNSLRSQKALCWCSVRLKDTFQMPLTALQKQC